LLLLFDRVWGVIVGVVLEDLAVAVEDFALGDEAHVVAVLVDDGEVPGSGVVKGLHHFLHGRAHDDLGGREQSLSNVSNVSNQSGMCM